MSSLSDDKKKDRGRSKTEAMLAYFEEKVRYTSKRSGMTEELNELIRRKLIEPDDALRGLEILTRAFIYDKSSYSEGYFDREHAKKLSNGIFYVDNLEIPTESSDDRTFYTKAYLKRAEMLINEVDLTFPAETKTEKLKTFANCFLEMSNNYAGIPDEALPYAGDTLRISDKIYQHAHSVLVLPDDPSQAVAALFGENPRLLFADYGGSESAEAMVQKMYGTDGAYAMHYRTFLDCGDRYPNQKHLLE